MFGGVPLFTPKEHDLDRLLLHGREPLYCYAGQLLWVYYYSLLVFDRFCGDFSDEYVYQTFTFSK